MQRHLHRMEAELKEIKELLKGKGVKTTKSSIYFN